MLAIVLIVLPEYRHDARKVISRNDLLGGNVLKQLEVDR